MKLYFHVDRLGNLSPGHVIEKEQYRNESILPAIMPYADERYLKHLEKLCRDGLSLHGAGYITVGLKRSRVEAVNLLLELQFEYVRHIYNENMPSRLQSLFAFSNLYAAQEFKRAKGDSGKIFEIDFSGRCFVGDMNWITASLNVEEQKQHAMQYWMGRPFSTKRDYIPQWECVIDLPVTIGREVTD